MTSDPASVAGAAVTCPSSRDSPSRLCQGQVPSGPDGKPWTPWRARKLYVPPGATSTRGAQGDERAGSGHLPGPCGEVPAGHAARLEQERLPLPGRRWPSAGAGGLTAVGAAASAAVPGPLSGDTDRRRVPGRCRGVHSRAGPPRAAPAPAVPEAHPGLPPEGPSSSRLGLSKSRWADAQAASDACARISGRGQRRYRCRLCAPNVVCFSPLPSESAAEL